MISGFVWKGRREPVSLQAIKLLQVLQVPSFRVPLLARIGHLARRPQLLQPQSLKLNLGFECLRILQSQRLDPKSGSVPCLLLSLLRSFCRLI